MTATFQGGPGKVPVQPAGPTVARQRPGSPAVLQMMQRSAGNAAVASYVQRLAESPGPVRPAGLAPSSDPRFLAVTSKVAAQGRALRQHPSPRSEVEKVKNAAVPPAGDKEAQAKEAQAATMAGAKPAGFDKAGFIAAVKAAIASQAPKTLEEAEEFGSSGKAETVKTQVAGKVTEGKAASAKDIADKTAAAPDQSKAVDKTVTPLAPEPQPAAGRADVAPGMPGPAPAEQTDLSGGKRDTDAAMAEADVSEQQLANSNEPEFVGAVAAKKAGEEHSASAPAAFRATEAVQLGSARQSAQAAGAAGLGGMLSAKKGALGRSTVAKGAAKSTDEAERAKVAGEVKAIFDATKKDVDAILGSLDGAVAKEFSEGEKDVREAFTADVKRRMAAYKNRRYSGWDGDLLWAKDKLFNLPKEADQEYVAARLKYESGMAALIGRVADTIGAKLTEAKDRIARGRAEIKACVDSKPKNLQKIAQAAASQFAGQFDQLESDVDSKKDALVEDLAAKYVESRASVDAEITAMQDENKGLWDKAKEAVGGAIKTVLQLKDLLLNVLARAANAVGKIIKDPVGFLGNFVNAVKGGIVQFGRNIAEHLEKGLQGWLLGALAEGGIELPAQFDLKGIVQLLMFIFGMTWAHIRARIVAKVGEPVMGKLEKGFEVIRILVTEGIGGLWKWVQQKIGDVKEMIMSQIQEMVSVEIIKAGIVWLISLLNPASAFVKACKMIYDVVMFFVEKAEQIKAFVDSVLDSVESIAAGGVGAVAGYIEKTLARMLPVLIGFLASLLGLGGISGKIKKILETLQKPMTAVVDWVVSKAIKYGKKLMGFARKVGGKLKAKGKELLGKGKKKLGIREKTPEQIETEKKDRLQGGLDAAGALVRRLGAKRISGSILRPLLIGIKVRYRMQSLSVEPESGKWIAHGLVNPSAKRDTGIGLEKGLPDEAKVHALIGQANEAYGQAVKLHISKYSAVHGTVVAVPGGGGPEASFGHEIQGAGDMRSAARERIRRKRSGDRGESHGRRMEPDSGWTRGSGEHWTRTEWRIREELSQVSEKDRAAVGGQYGTEAGALQQRKYFEDRGKYVPQRSHRDPKHQLGRSALVHAEKMVIQRSRTQVVGVSTLPMCSDCQTYFRAKALARQTTLVVGDSIGVHVFLADGSVRSADNAVRAAAPAAAIVA